MMHGNTKIKKVGQVFVGKLEIFPDGIIPAVLRTRSFVKNRRRYITLANGRIVN